MLRVPLILLLALQTPTPATASRLDSLLAAGERQARTGNARAADSTLRLAGRLASEAGDRHAELRALRWLVDAMVTLDSDPTVPLTRMLELARAAGDREHSGWAENGIAHLALDRGELARAGRGFEAARDHFVAAGSVAGRARAEYGLGRVEAARGEGEAAMRRFAVAESLAVVGGDARTQGNIVNSMGARVFFRDPGAAIRHWKRAVDAFRRGGDEHGQLTPLFNLAMANTHAGSLGEAAEALEAIIPVSEARGYRLRHQNALLQLGIVRRLQGDLEASAALLERAVAMRAGGVGDHLFAVQQVATTLLERGEPGEALERIRRGVAEEPRPIPYEQRRRLFRVEGECLQALGRHREALPLHLDGIEEEGAGTNPVTRFVRMVPAAECYRALDRPDSAERALSVAVVAWESLRTVPTNREWRTQRGAVARRLYANLLALRLAHPDSLAAGERARRAFDSVQRFKSRTLLERLRGPGPATHAEARGWTSGAERLQREVLAPGEVFLDFFVGPDESWVFAVTRDTLVAAALPGRRALRRAVWDYLLFASAPRRGAGSAATRRLADRAGAGLSRLLLGDLVAWIPPGATVLYAPDDQLHGLPIGALPDPAAGNEPLMAGRRVCAVPSASALAAMRERARAPRETQRLAVIGDERSLLARDLRAAARESRWVLRRYRNSTPTGGDDGRGWQERLRDAEVLHFAGHVDVDFENPWDSGLSLGRSHAAAGESLLAVSEIASLRLGARLCVLSGCGSALGRVYAGEGSMHTAAAFVEAGVPSVVATLWRVEDRVTERIMTRFYRGLERGLPASEALRLAQLEIRRDAATRHPFHWAGFVLIGDPSTTVRLARRLEPPAWAFALLLGPAALAWLGWRRNSRTRAVTERREGTS